MHRGIVHSLLLVKSFFMSDFEQCRNFWKKFILSSKSSIGSKSTSGRIPIAFDRIKGTISEEEEEEEGLPENDVRVLIRKVLFFRIWIASYWFDISILFNWHGRKLNCFNIWTTSGSDTSVVWGYWREVSSSTFIDFIAFCQIVWDILLGSINDFQEITSFISRYNKIPNKTDFSIPHHKQIITNTHVCALSPLFFCPTPFPPKKLHQYSIVWRVSSFTTNRGQRFFIESSIFDTQPIPIFVDLKFATITIRWISSLLFRFHGFWSSWNNFSCMLQLLNESKNSLLKLR